MKYIKAVVCFGLFCFLSITQVKAFDWIPRIEDEIKIMPTATPTPTSIPFKPIRDIEMEIMPLSTATPTPISVVVTQVVTATPTPTAITEKISPSVAQNPSVEPDTAITETDEEVKRATEEAENTKDLSSWFWQITIGMLILIVIIQLWPKKKEGVKDKTDEPQL